MDRILYKYEGGRELDGRRSPKQNSPEILTSIPRIPIKSNKLNPDKHKNLNINSLQRSPLRRRRHRILETVLHGKRILSPDRQTDNPDYYECNMTSPHPNFVPLPASQVMGTRHRKLLRLQAQREQSLARRREGEPIKEVLSGEPSEKQNILQHLSNQNLSDLQNMDDDVEMESFDSEVHDIYYGNTMESRFRFAYSSNGPEESVLDVKKIKESDLIIDFRATNRSNQTNKNRQDIQNSQRAKPDLESQKSPYLSIVSPDQKVQKKKSFIGYYNSLQKKQPSRILQRYMKEKK